MHRRRGRAQAGSDCCGTCWFNAKNKGELGYGHSKDPEPAYCLIRELSVDDPFDTYCGNHPHRRPERDPIPIGPVYTGDAMGRREIWQPSPDTEEVRLHLIELLRATAAVRATLDDLQERLAHSL